MAEKYHISPTTGNPNRCYANTKPCPLGGEKDHYPTKEAARAGFEKSQAPALGGLKKTKKAPAAAPAVKKASKPAAAPALNDDEFYDFKEETLDDVDFDPNEAVIDDDWEDDLFKEEKDEWGDDDDVWDSSRMSPDDYESRTSGGHYSWDR